MTADIEQGGHGWGPKYIAQHTADQGHSLDHEIWTQSPWLSDIFNDMLPEGFHTHEAPPPPDPHTGIHNYKQLENCLCFSDQPTGPQTKDCCGWRTQ